MSDLSREQAVALYESGWWEKRPLPQAARLQLFTTRLIMPFDKFHEGLQLLLGRPVWTHEMGLNLAGLQAEATKTGPRPTMDDVFALVPTERLIAVIM